MNYIIKTHVNQKTKQIEKKKDNTINNLSRN